MRVSSRTTLVRLAITGLALHVAGVARPASAAWPAFGRGVCTAATSQQHASIATDGEGGAIVTWQDFRFRRVNVFTQHLLASGEVDVHWPANGQAMLRDSLALADADGGQISPLIVTDGAGGAIVAWLDLRSAATDTDVFAQHVLASGIVDSAWPANGTPICVIEGIQNSLDLVPDGAGGAILTWLDGRPGANGTDIFAQHVLASGDVDPRWPVNGIAVSAAPGSQESPAITGDGAGGAIIAWHDTRRDPNNFDIFAQHVLGSGVVDPAWPLDGLATCTATGSQAFPTIVPDGAGGAVLAWTDGRVFAQSHIFAQHLLAAGAVDPAWPVDGRAVSGSGDQETRPLAVPDGAGGLIVTWQSFSFKLTEYAQHVTAAGVVDPAWPLGGRALSTSELDQTMSAIASDGAGGAIVAWKENFDVLAQHVLASGALDPTYPGAGRVLCGLPSGQGDPALVSTGGGGAIAAWSDTRNGTDLDIYAMQVLEAVTTGVPDSTPGSVALSRAGPNPARGSALLRFSLRRNAPVRLVIFDASGRRVRVLVSGTRPAGVHAITWDLRDESGRAVPSAIYFARLEAEGRAFTEKLATLK